MSRKNNSVKTEDVKAEDVNHDSYENVWRGPARKLHSGSQTDVLRNAVTVHVLNADGTDELPAGSLLVVCTDPGFKRAGIEHERLKVYRDGELTGQQIAQMSREPKLTLVKVS